MAYPTSNANLVTNFAGTTLQAGVHPAHHDAVATEINSIETDLLPGGILRTTIDGKAAGNHTHTVLKPYGTGLYNSNGLATGVFDLGVVEKAGTMDHIRIKCRDGTSVTVNVRKNGTTLFFAADQTVSAGAWTNITALQNVAVAVGDYLELMLNAVSGLVTQMGVRPVVAEAD